ncbi:hypothetical protein [Duganella sp. BJB1802]|uniref:hypothetical protein n=1 Tax=Duganella sp. BJB1802 TaxID=2744575 RepID=UPI001E2D9F53|nr:hypothetical protein [Duganella sp. BJB1802]
MSDPTPAGIRSLDELIAYEQTPWQQRLPARSTYELLRQACARHPQRTALRFVPTGAPDAPEYAVDYRTLHEQVTRAANGFFTAPASRPARR